MHGVWSIVVQTGEMMQNAVLIVVPLGSLEDTSPLWNVRRVRRVAHGPDGSGNPLKSFAYLYEINNFHWIILFLSCPLCSVFEIIPFSVSRPSAISGFPWVPWGGAPPVVGIPVPSFDPAHCRHDLWLHTVCPWAANQRSGLLPLCQVHLISWRLGLHNYILNSKSLNMRGGKCYIIQVVKRSASSDSCISLASCLPYFLHPTISWS